MKGAAGGGHGVRKSSYKRARRARFRVRADEQIRADLEQKLSNKGGEKESQAAGEKKRFGPVGTINKVLLDEDIPGLGRWYCEVCSRYFANEHSLLSHLKTKKHKRRYKLFYDNKTGQLKCPEDIYHTQAMADAAKGRGKTDNGVAVNGMKTDTKANTATATATATSTSSPAAMEEQIPEDFGEL